MANWRPCLFKGMYCMCENENEWRAINSLLSEYIKMYLTKPIPQTQQQQLVLLMTNWLQQIYDPSLHLPSSCQPRRAAPIYTSPCIGAVPMQPYDSIMSHPLQLKLFQRAGKSSRQAAEQSAINNTEPHPFVNKIYMKRSIYAFPNEGAHSLNSPCHTDMLTLVRTHGGCFCFGVKLWFKMPGGEPCHCCLRTDEGVALMKSLTNELCFFSWF